MFHLKPVAQQLFHCLGGLEFVRWLNRRALRILMYHRFPYAAALERQCSYIKQHYIVIALQQAAECMESGRGLPPNALVVTVDDGYRDFIEVAYPIFRAHDVPVTVFLVTDFIDGKLWLWPDWLRYLIENSPRPRIELTSRAGSRIQLDLSSPGERQEAARVLVEDIKRFPNDERLRFISHAEQLFGIRFPVRAPALFQPLCWEEIRLMSANGVEFGAHTKTHPILSTVNQQDQLQEEIQGSKKRIEEQIGVPCLHFCYPNGKLGDLNPPVVESVKAAGFKTAVTTEVGLNRNGADRFLLRRIGVEPDTPDSYFRQCAAGFRM